VVVSLGYSAHDRRVSRSCAELRKHPQDAQFGLHPLGAGLRGVSARQSRFSVKILTNRGKHVAPSRARMDFWHSDKAGDELTSASPGRAGVSGHLPRHAWAGGPRLVRTAGGVQTALPPMSAIGPDRDVMIPANSRPGCRITLRGMGCFLTGCRNIVTPRGLNDAAASLARTSSTLHATSPRRRNG